MAPSWTTVPIFFVMLISLRFNAALGAIDPVVANGTEKTMSSGLHNISIANSSSSCLVESEGVVVFPTPISGEHSMHVFTGLMLWFE